MCKALKIFNIGGDIMSEQNLFVSIQGKLLKIASIHDEPWLEFNSEAHKKIIKELKDRKRKADIFTFCQKLPDTEPKYNYQMEWDNVAAIPITTYDDWWTKRLPQTTRKNVRRGYKRGVISKISEFNDDLVKGIMDIYNETPVRQGRLFPHYSCDFDYVKKGNSSYLANSNFICAYFEENLIGFIKLVYVGKTARIMQIIAMNKHQDKRVTNLLIAKSVEVCTEKKMDFIIYGNFIYGTKTKSPIIEFKKRNGFEMIKLPRYYIPLTSMGKIALKLKLHHDIKQFIPEKIFYYILDLRERWYAKKYPEQGNDK